MILKAINYRFGVQVEYVKHWCEYCRKLTPGNKNEGEIIFCGDCGKQTSKNIKLVKDFQNYNGKN